MSKDELPDDDKIGTHHIQWHKKFHWKWFFKAMAITGAIFFAIVYVHYCPMFNQALFNAILLHPTKKTDGTWDEKSVAGHPYKDVFFQAKNGRKLHGWYFVQPDAKYTFLFLHGNGQNLSYRTALDN